MEENTFVTRYPYETLENVWLTYKDENIQGDGRTVDPDQNFLTTSEGQSYSMLRAVWMDDKQTFDRVLEWTKNNLQKRTEDQLFSWKWGQRSDGSWGVLTDEGGYNTASDADLDIALALILANKRWNQDYYLDEARKILNDIWAEEVVLIGGRPYLVAGNWAATEPDPTVNPSYYNFAAYSIFAEVDPIHDWMGVKDTSYEVLNQATKALPPDWASISGLSGEVIPLQLPDKTEHFSDDAIRAVWRVGLDWSWHKDERAFRYLNRLTFLSEEWNNRGTIFKTYSLDGVPLTNEETVATYGALIPYFAVIDPSIAKEVYSEKLAGAYNTITLKIGDNSNYYSKNWGWFGLAFVEGNLINLYEI